MQSITRQELEEKINQGEDFALVEVLANETFRRYHLPGAINVPINDQFGDRIQQAIPDHDKPVVVYCTNAHCTASPQAGRELERLGYSTVLDYEGGKEDWRDAGLPIERGS